MMDFIELGFNVRETIGLKGSCELIEGFHEGDDDVRRQTKEVRDVFLGFLEELRIVVTLDLRLLKSVANVSPKI